MSATSSVVSIPSQDKFFDGLKVLCGQAFVGKVSVDNAASASDFSTKRLLMHVRKCYQDRIEIPFHVGSNASRTWVITKTGSGLSLKHDHRHQDGSPDAVTMYGGHTTDKGWPQVQSFPADAYSQELFVEHGLPQSIGNTWQMYLYPDKFSYRLIRQGREFRVDFDITQPVAAPKAPWGYKDE